MKPKTIVSAAPAKPRCTVRSLIALTSTLLLFTGVSSAAPTSRLVAAHDILYHDVLGQDGEKVGAVTDLLIAMPSAQILFVAVTPSDLFKRPKAIPLDALAPAKKGALQLRIPLDTWLSAPEEARNGQWVEQFASNAFRILARYNLAWVGSRPVPEAARFASTVPTPRYVSMRDLLDDNVVDGRQQKVGQLGDFLIDWNARQAVYAIASQETPGLADVAVTHGFAIPTTMLTPPSARGTIMVSITPEIARTAPLLSSSRNGAPNPDQIFRYQAGTAVANAAR